MILVSCVLSDDVKDVLFAPVKGVRSPATVEQVDELAVVLLDYYRLKISEPFKI